MIRIVKFKYLLAFCLLVLLMSGISEIAFAQPGDPGGDPDVPISGIEWLLVSGALFGARKIYYNFKKR
ncbi:MAG: hypothetical protein ABIR06_00650 [Cyclobacteriaceae bacterium]